MTAPLAKVRKDELHNSEIYVRLIDILFAVVLGQSFVLLASTPGYHEWFALGSIDVIGIFAIAVVYLLIITSWVGYHRSVANYPILYPVRFAMDIFLLFVYYAAFSSIRDFGFLLLYFFIAFVTYTVWDMVRIFEYWNRLVGAKRWENIWRFIVSLIFALVFGLLWYLYVAQTWIASAIGEGGFIVTMFFFLFLYRVQKWKYKE